MAGFLVCGGTSVTENALVALRRSNHRVVAINSSYLAVPWADAVLFSDPLWWELHKDRPEFTAFFGNKISLVPVVHDDLCLVLRCAPPFATMPHGLAIGVTTVLAGLDLLQKTGVNRIGLLGFDGANGSDGRVHHHEPHPAEWGREPRAFQVHGREVAKVAPLLRDKMIEVVNCNPNSAHMMFPRMPLEAVLEKWK